MNKLKPQKVDWPQIERFLQSAEKKLASANKILAFDEEASLRSDAQSLTVQPPQCCSLRLKSFRTISPPFITNFTRWSSVMSFRGLPETAMISAYLPFSMDPTRSCQPIISAFTVVAARKACAGFML